MSEEHEFDENVTSNISPERRISNDSYVPSTSGSHDSHHSSEDEENCYSTPHRKKIDKAGFHLGKTHDEDKDVEAEGSCWYNRSCFSYFTFDTELMQSKPKDNDNLKGICKKCFKKCSGQVRSTTNWMRHIKKHPDLYADYKKKKKERKQARDSVTETIAARKKIVAVRQSLLNFSSPKAPSKLSKLEQSKIDALIMNFIITNALPLNTVDDPAFIALINGLNPRANVMCAKKLKSLIESAHHQIKVIGTASTFHTPP